MTVLGQDTNNVLRDSLSHACVWELSCAGFRHSADFHARVILDGACRLGELGDVYDVVGGDLFEPVVLRVLVSW